MGKWMAVLCLVACSSKAKKLEGDIDIQIGDCAPATIAFISGPRPQPFDIAKLDGKSVYAKVGAGFGWGLIGTGRYGMIGDETPKPEPANVPTVAIGQPNAAGDLDKAIIRRYIKRNIQKIQYCYEKELLANPRLAGTITVQFFIKPDGNVSTASASGVDKNVSSCVAAVIKAIEFPKPKGGGGVQVNYPFTFRPAGGAEPVKVKDASKDDPPPPEDESGGTGTAMALDEGKMGAKDARQQAIDAAREAGILGSTAIDPRTNATIVENYHPGATSPLHGVQGELVECFRLQSKRYGVAVIDLDGKTTTAEGIDHSGFKSCVKKLKIPSDQPQRCSVAFGTMPVTEAPGIDITADAIKLSGKFLADPRKIQADPNAPTFKIDALFEAVDARVKAALGKAPVAIHGPLVVRPLGTTPMLIVNKVHDSTIAAGDDPVYAVQRDNQWKLLQPMQLPVVPVPVGSGVTWSGHDSTSDDGATEDETVQLSVFVTVDGIWIGLSRVNEFIEVKGMDLAKLEDYLKQHKQSAFFADRNDAEVAGDANVPYENVAKVIESVMKTGFTRWRLVDPEGLSARPQL